MGKPELSFETVERWRNIIRAIGAGFVIVGSLIAFPFLQGLLEGHGSGASHDLGADTARALALSASPWTLTGLVVAAFGVLLLLIGHFVIR